MLNFGFYNMDCMQGMKEFPDKYFDLAIVDPPYGGAGKDVNETFNGALYGRFGGNFEKYIKVDRTGGTWAQKYGSEIIEWDNAPDENYFKELFRVSKAQIVFGANYFTMPPSRNFIVWVKNNIPEDFTMAMCEYAWVSRSGNAKVFYCSSIRDKTSGKFHPTEKPIKLYEWILQNYAKDGDKILDTHVGSASSLIACYNTNHKYVGFEINKTYYEKAKKRLEAATSQMNLFTMGFNPYQE